MSAEYQKALALEADRERKWRQTTRQGRFESAMLSLDALRDSFEDPDSVATFSDGGVAAESIRSFDEPDALAAYEQKKEKRAEQTPQPATSPEDVAADHRERNQPKGERMDIDDDVEKTARWKAALALYRAHVKKLLKIFDAQ